MRLIKSNDGEVKKEAETAEDYLLLEIERLKEENESLKKELEKKQEDYMIKFYLYGFLNEEYKVKTEYGKIKIEQLQKKRKEEK